MPVGPSGNLGVAPCCPLQRGGIQRKTSPGPVVPMRWRAPGARKSGGERSQVGSSAPGPADRPHNPAATAIRAQVKKMTNGLLRMSRKPEVRCIHLGGKAGACAKQLRRGAGIRFNPGAGIRKRSCCENHHSAQQQEQRRRRGAARKARCARPMTTGGRSAGQGHRPPFPRKRPHGQAGKWRGASGARWN